MKKFALNTLLFFCLYAAVLVGVRAAFPPAYYWGNDYYAQKMECFAGASDSVNTVFIGSSRVYRSIDPAVFDSVVNEGQSAGRIRSYNLGAPATFPAEAYMLCEELIKSSSHLDYIFLELNIQPENKNLGSTRGSYWLGWNQTAFSLDEIQADDLHKNKSEESMQVIKTYVQNLLTLRYLAHQPADVSFACGKRMNGFYTLDEHYAEHGGGTVFPEHDRFLKDSSDLFNRITEMRELYSTFKPQPATGKHLEELEKLNALCKEKNIQLIILIPPRITTEHVLNIAHAYSGKYVLDYCNPESYPAFFDPAFAFDPGHLNRAGSRYFTLQLARDFKRMIRSTP